MLNEIQDFERELSASLLMLESQPATPENQETIGHLRQAQHEARQVLGGTSFHTGPILSRLLSAVRLRQWDPGWVNTVIHRVRVDEAETRNLFIPFDATAPLEDVLQGMEDVVRIALAGDWGTQLPSSIAIRDSISAFHPDYSIHLGDVYYSGTREESEAFVMNWPVGTRGSFSLNSNHEMYSGGEGYFGVTLRHPKFALQRGRSYFALENAHWIIVGLDSAIDAPGFLYHQGVVRGSQWELLQLLGQRARQSGKKMCLLTHHHAIEKDGDWTSLGRDVMLALRGGPGTLELYWYWGHEHFGVVFPEMWDDFDHTIRIHGRCVGHGGVPTRSLGANDYMEALFCEREVVLGERRLRSGFVTLDLDGPDIGETFFSENGALRWPVVG